MSKPLNERLAGAIGDMRARLTDMEALLAEADVEAERLASIVAQAARDSIDFALSEELRDKAAADGDRARRNAAALAQARKALEARITERRASETAVAARREKDRIIAERDALAERLRTEWPAIEATIVELLTAIMANDAELIAHRLPEASAEAIARGCSGNFRTGGIAVPRLVEIVLPGFDGKSLDRAWPLPKRTKGWSEMARENMLAQRKAAREQEHREAASWSPYLVSAGNAKAYDTVFYGKAHQGAPVTERHVYRDPGTGSTFERERAEAKLVWLQEPTVVRLREQGLSVERAPESKPTAIAEPQLIGTTSASF
ncbi:hypothetical protein [Novosphingobium sp.]|uniref:hypothetical protein n=1 Tax=Novosphingobium sp. TaxID=1874826 RepID=UPI00262FD426|nr:hypothetical protein [Novosphingobium sp.]